MIDHAPRPVLLLDGKIVNYVNLELRIKVDDGDDVVLTHLNAERARMAQLEAAVEALRGRCIEHERDRLNDAAPKWLHTPTTEAEKAELRRQCAEIDAKSTAAVDALIAEAAPMLAD